MNPDPAEGIPKWPDLRAAFDLTVALCLTATWHTWTATHFRKDFTTWIHVAESLKSWWLQLVKNYPYFMKTESSFCCSEGPSTCLDSESHKPNPCCLFISLFHIHFNIILPPTIWPPKIFSTKPCSPFAYPNTKSRCQPQYLPCPCPFGKLQHVFCPHVTVQSQFQSYANNSCTLSSKQQEHQRSWTEMRQQTLPEFYMGADLFVSVNSLFWMKSSCYFTKRTILYIKNSNVN